MPAMYLRPRSGGGGGIFHPHLGRDLPLGIKKGTWEVDPIHPNLYQNFNVWWLILIPRFDGQLKYQPKKNLY